MDKKLKENMKKLKTFNEFINEAKSEAAKKLYGKNWADYGDIGQFSVPEKDWDKYSDEDFMKMGKELVDKKFKGDIKKAYDAIVEGENDEIEGGDPCWDGYEMVGTKMKNGKEVPNCVPVEEAARLRESKLNEAKGKDFKTKEWLKKFIFNDEEIFDIPGLSLKEDDIWREWAAKLAVEAYAKVFPDWYEEEDLQYHKGKVDWVASSEILVGLSDKDLDKVYKEASKKA